MFVNLGQYVMLEERVLFRPIPKNKYSKTDRT